MPPKSSSSSTTRNSGSGRPPKVSPSSVGIKRISPAASTSKRPSSKSVVTAASIEGDDKKSSSSARKGNNKNGGAPPIDPSWYFLPSLPLTIKGSARAPLTTRWVSLHCRSPNMPMDTIIRVPPTSTIDYVKEKLAQHHGGTVEHIEIYKSLHRGDRLDEKSIVQGRTNTMTVREVWNLEEVEHDAVQIPANSGFANSSVFGLNSGGVAASGNASVSFGRRRVPSSGLLDESNFGSGISNNNNNHHNRSMSPAHQQGGSNFSSAMGSPLAPTTGGGGGGRRGVVTMMMNQSNSGGSNSNSPTSTNHHHPHHHHHRVNSTSLAPSSMSPTTMNPTNPNMTMNSQNFLGGTTTMMMGTTMTMNSAAGSTMMMMSNNNTNPNNNNSNAPNHVSFASPHSGFPTGGYYVADTTSPVRRIPSVARESPDRYHHLTSYQQQQQNQHQYSSALNQSGSNEHVNHNNNGTHNNNNMLNTSQQVSPSSGARAHRIGSSDALSLSGSGAVVGSSSSAAPPDNTAINVHDDHVVLYYVFGPHKFASPLLFC